MSLLKHNVVQWLLAAAIVLGSAWATGTTVFAPRLSTSRIVPDAVLDSSFVLPPNYSDFGFTPRELITLFAKRGISARWESQAANRYILRFGGESRLTGAPLDTAFQLHWVIGPHEVVSQVIGFTGPALVVEAMAEDGIAVHWVIMTRLFEGLQSALAEEPGSGLHTLVQTQQPTPSVGAPAQRPIPTPGRPTVLTPTAPR
ncbi:hypothetical protein ASG51_22425 [Methylobacterium sp. Leaf465]|uniref:hypothetical protein n=1 Tax=Methylobacterium sp. Leaf465 TaxID=1736385 RepID=UPI0006F83BDB|nr:hypothetical protein [Methylobacterium sp. Leaf465]KQT77465.1 hypothetical protein ASG51_22425 [Methylobacterium sp. Leaf465]